MQRTKKYADEGYTQVVEVDLSKYFDTLNHELLMNLLRKQIQDNRVIRLIKKYLKRGVMENNIFCKTDEGSPQGGPLSPLLANIYLNEFDQEMSVFSQAFFPKIIMRIPMFHQWDFPGLSIRPSDA